MTFEQYVDQVFFEEHNGLGMERDDIQELFQSSTFKQRLKWIRKIGYDIDFMYNADVLTAN